LVSLSPDAIGIESELEGDGSVVLLVRLNRTDWYPSSGCESTVEKRPVGVDDVATEEIVTE